MVINREPLELRLLVRAAVEVIRVARLVNRGTARHPGNQGTAPRRPGNKCKACHRSNHPGNQGTACHRSNTAALPLEGHRGMECLLLTSKAPPRWVRLPPWASPHQGKACPRKECHLHKPAPQRSNSGR